MFGIKPTLKQQREKLLIHRTLASDNMDRLRTELNHLEKVEQYLQPQGVKIVKRKYKELDTFRKQYDRLSHDLWILDMIELAQVEAKEVNK